MYYDRFHVTGQQLKFVPGKKKRERHWVGVLKGNGVKIEIEFDEYPESFDMRTFSEWEITVESSLSQMQTTVDELVEAAKKKQRKEKKEEGVIDG